MATDLLPQPSFRRAGLPPPRFWSLIGLLIDGLLCGGLFQASTPAVLFPVAAFAVASMLVAPLAWRFLRGSGVR